MSPRPFILMIVSLVVVGACSGEASVEVSTTIVGESSPDSSAETSGETEAASDSTEGDEVEAMDEESAAGDGAPFEMIESYEEWQSDPLAPLVPNPQQFGPEWGNLGLLRYAEQVLIDPAAEDLGDDCFATEPVVIRDGFYAEFGAGESPDDAVVVVTQGSPDQLADFYRGMFAVFACEDGSDLLETTFTQHPSPELPGVSEATRFSTDDNLGQHGEGLLLRRDDLVHLLLITAPDGAAPIDVNAVVAQLLAEYDAR